MLRYLQCFAILRRSNSPNKLSQNHTTLPLYIHRNSRIPITPATCPFRPSACSPFAPKTLRPAATAAAKQRLSGVAGGKYAKSTVDWGMATRPHMRPRDAYAGPPRHTPAQSVLEPLLREQVRSSVGSAVWKVSRGLPAEGLSWHSKWSVGRLGVRSRR